MELHGEIDVAAVMEAARRSREREEERYKEFDRRCWKIRIDNALWAYHHCPDQEGTVKLYREEFDRYNLMKKRANLGS